ncbi:Myb-like DNA-binding domain [Musa troglodytarum]|uniref:Myb-like DNA-binding domain n=1 Tax=Musa troglodytarum TaxID=320322 RepID=A0A9E7L5S0_9LILI|nr:Myb-like DNA-binding domain [Musa troglodytarum]
MSTGSRRESTCSNSSRFPDRSSGGWTWEENKLFELALVEFKKDTPGRWEKVAACVPGKTVEEVKIHYQRLIDDLNAIEVGRFSYYPSFTSNSEGCYASKQPSCASGKRSASRAPSEHERKKGVPWNEEEHKSVSHPHPVRRIGMCLSNIILLVNKSWLKRFADDAN